MEQCRPYLLDELCRLERLSVVVALGRIGFTTYLRARRNLGLGNPRPQPAFGHARAFVLPDGVTLIGSYHPSQQNTFTGRLTEPMFDRVFGMARDRLADR
jgi:uracil-DNA glycosylase